MTMSSGSSSPASSSSTGPVTAAGSISQTARGFSSLATKSASDDAPAAPSSASCFTCAAVWSYTTHWCPSRISRRTRLAPIRPSPTMPSCMGLSVVMRFS